MSRARIAGPGGSEQLTRGIGDGKRLASILSGSLSPSLQGQVERKSLNMDGGVRCMYGRRAVESAARRLHGPSDTHDRALKVCRGPERNENMGMYEPK